jgi:hypothetical protein
VQKVYGRKSPFENFILGLRLGFQAPPDLRLRLGHERDSSRNGLSNLLSVYNFRQQEIPMHRSTLIAICLLAVTAQAQTVSTSEASKHIGEQATVCGQIADRHTAEKSNGKPTFVDLDHAFPNQTFTIVIWERDKAGVGDFPSSGNVCVTGQIAQYKGIPQIVLHDAKSWSMAPKPAAAQ